MSELSDLIGIYGEIDRAVAADGDRRADVSRLLPIYHSEDARWFDEFRDWTIERRGEEVEGEPFPSRDEALQDLAEIPARGRMVARRLFAIALTGRAFPELLADDDGRAALAGALMGVNGIEDDERAQRLLDLLVDEGLLPEHDPEDADGWWDNLLEVAFEEGLLPDEPGLIGPRPCTGGLVTVEMPDGRGPVAILQSGFDTDKIPFASAIRFLEPVNWRDCSAFWCEMKNLNPLAPAPHHYHEVVSTDCAHRPTSWTIEAYLDFGFFQIPGKLAIAEYGLTKPHPLPADDVLVDEGSLVVREIGSAAAPMLRVTTTKRIRFNRPFSGEALALIMCALGYASVVEDLVFSCAAVNGDQAGTPFPGEDDAAHLAPGAAGAPDEYGRLVKACLDECVDAAQASSKKMAEGSYTADDLVKDVAAMWVRTVKEGAKGLDLAARGAQKVARPRDPEP